jgi:hypothetical protein
MIYVSLIYVSIKKQASKQRNLSVGGAIPDRAKQLSTVPSYHHQVMPPRDIISLKAFMFKRIEHVINCIFI